MLSALAGGNWQTLQVFENLRPLAHHQRHFHPPPPLLQYPHLVDGVIAGSAPIWSFMGERPAVDGGYFAKVGVCMCVYVALDSVSCLLRVRM